MTHTEGGVDAILAGSFMAREKVDGGDKSFAQVIMEAGKTYNISPYYLASRILQETGYTRSSLVKGDYDGVYDQFDGYYNFFNYGAGGTDVVYNGLNYAYNKGWNSEEKAIFGGTSLIGTSYINVGQDTGIFKMGVVCSKMMSMIVVFIPINICKTLKLLLVKLIQLIKPIKKYLAIIYIIYRLFLLFLYITICQIKPFYQVKIIQLTI